MIIGDEFNITGRGLVVVVTLEGDEKVEIGDTFIYKNKEYLIRGLEISRILTYPTKLSPHVGLLLRRVKK